MRRGPTQQEHKHTYASGICICKCPYMWSRDYIKVYRTLHPLNTCMPSACTRPVAACASNLSLEHARVLGAI